jgi:hypothetical protein
MKLQKRVLPCALQTQITAHKSSVHSWVFCPLFAAIAGALLLTGTCAPQANATLIMYFNFEDTPNTDEGPGAPAGTDYDGNADALPCVNGGPCPNAPDSDNTGGGIQFSKLTVVTGANVSTAGGLLDNRASGDIDPAAPVPPSFNGHALLFNNTKNTSATISFTVDTSFLTGLSLSFATDNNGNGYNNVKLEASVNSGSFFAVGGPAQTMGLGVSIMTFNIGDGGGVFLGSGTPQSTVFRLTFTGTNTSNGNDRQTAIDNIQLTAAIVPEPATVAGGLLGLCGLCWHQRRRLVRSPRLKRA